MAYRPNSIRKLQATLPSTMGHSPASLSDSGRDVTMKQNHERPAALATEDETPTYPPTRTVVMVMAALYVAMFLVSLVRADLPGDSQCGVAC